jgi:hypothetical protein
MLWLKAKKMTTQKTTTAMYRSVVFGEKKYEVIM